jgi:hypothetical protein
VPPLIKNTWFLRIGLGVIVLASLAFARHLWLEGHTLLAVYLAVLQPLLLYWAYKAVN